MHGARDRFVSVAEDSTLQVLTLPQVGEKVRGLSSTKTLHFCVQARFQQWTAR